MFANERRNIILQMAKKDGAVTTASLVKHFGVSIETIRRDLLSLEENGHITRVHGGAVVASEMKNFLALEERNEENNTLKEELSSIAAEYVCEGDIIGVDSGSTAIFFAKELRKKFRKLTVITHSLDVFNLLSRHEGFSLILCGGYFKSEENSFYGSLVTDTLSSLRTDKVFVCPSAISLKGGICDFEQNLYQVQKKLLSIGNSSFILADSTKFEKTALLKIDDMINEYTYIPDSHLSESLFNLYKESGLSVICKKN